MLAGLEYLTLLAILVFVILLNWNSKRTPLHLLWMLPVGGGAFLVALCLVSRMT